MNDNVKLWIKTLRSGEYQQGKRKLRSPDPTDGAKLCYCCLGVGCDLYMKETGKGSWDSRCGFVDSSGTIRDAVLSQEVQDWLGLSTFDGEFTTNEGALPEHRDSLTRLNDCGNDFNHIADVIESNPKGLFKSE